MIPQKLRFLLYVLILISLQNCKKATTPLHNDKNNIIEIKRLTDLGEKFYSSNELDSSYYYFNKAKLACDPKKHTKQFVYAISSLATIQQNQGNYVESENIAMEAMPILESTNNAQFKWNIYTILTLNYLNTQDIENAINFNNKAIILNTDIPRKIASLNNLAQIQTEKGEYAKALKIYKDFLLMSEVYNDESKYSQVLSNIGYCFNKTNNSQALYYLEKSLKIRSRIKDEIGLIATYYNLSTYYKQKNQNLALQYSKIAYQKAIKLNSTDDKIGCLKLIIELSKEADLKKYSTQYVRLNDSIIKARQVAKNQFAKIKYDSKKEKDENLILKTERAEKDLLLEKQKNSNLILSAVLIIGLLTFLIIFYFIKQKNKKEKIQTSYSTEIRISKQLHDELANDLYQTMSFAETQDLSTATNKELLLENLDTIYSRTRNISKENSTIDTGIYYGTNLKNLISDFNTETVNIIVSGFDAIDWQKVEAVKKIVMYRVIQELLVNMKKHSQCNLVLLSFKEDNKSIYLNYSDNGIGSNDNESIARYGLQNMTSRINSIAGKISLDTKIGKGYKVNIQIPI